MLRLLTLNIDWSPGCEDNYLTVGLFGIFVVYEVSYTVDPEYIGSKKPLGLFSHYIYIGQVHIHALR